MSKLSDLGGAIAGPGGNVTPILYAGTRKSTYKIVRLFEGRMQQCTLEIRGNMIIEDGPLTVCTFTNT